MIKHLHDMSLGFGWPGRIVGWLLHRQGMNSYCDRTHIHSQYQHIAQLSIKIIINMHLYSFSVKSA